MTICLPLGQGVLPSSLSQPSRAFRHRRCELLALAYEMSQADGIIGQERGAILPLPRQALRDQDSDVGGDRTDALAP